MRDIVRATTDAIRPPGRAQRDEASAAWGSAQAHDTFVARWSCFNEIELAGPPVAPAPKRDFTVAAWNIERCKDVGESARVIGRSGADIVLATELDYGMARSGQCHTTRDLAAELGFGHAFGVEFVELGLGDERETEECAGMANRHGLHGNAILSRWPLEDVALIPLDDGGLWYVGAPKKDGQYRVGGRMAVTGRIATPSGPVALAALHLESEGDAAGRARQIENLLDGFGRLYGDGPAIIGGDLNTKAFLAEGLSGPDMLADPASAEPCFAAFARHGFDWRDSNTGGITTRRPPWAPIDWPLQTLDWLFVRGVAAHGPLVHQALSEEGDYLSDHEPVSARIRI
jgi:endonuclease/exonuclease/phosphatase family metal-dependent hydrolase